MTSEDPREIRHRRRDGGVLAARTFGLGGAPYVVYCHGFPGSRIEPQMLGERLDTWSGSLIAFDRPGIGRSSRAPRTTPAQLAESVLEFLDARSVSRFRVLAVSGGAPWGLHLARAAQARCRGLGLVGGLAPPDPTAPFAGMSPLPRKALSTLRRHPGVAGPLGRALCTALRVAPGAWVRVVAGISAEPDRTLLRTPRFARLVRRSFREHARGDHSGTATDLRLYATGWPLPPLSAELPIQIWHGRRDGTVPFAAAERHLDHYAHARLHTFDQEAHFSLPVSHFKAILDELTGDSPR